MEEPGIAVAVAVAAVSLSGCQPRAAGLAVYAVAGVAGSSGWEDRRASDYWDHRSGLVEGQVAIRDQGVGHNPCRSPVEAVREVQVVQEENHSQGQRRADLESRVARQVLEI